MRITRKARVAGVPAAAPEAALAHFSARLRYETDPADVYADLTAGAEAGFVLVDTRNRAAFAAEHLPGAINLQPEEMTETRLRDVPPDRLLVTYCWSVSCNGSTRGAVRLAELGRPVKEMLGGINAWKAEGYPTERSP